MAVNKQNRSLDEGSRNSAALFTPTLQLGYDACKMYSIHKLYYVHLSHHIAGLINNNCIFVHIAGSSFMRTKMVEGEMPHKGLVRVSVMIIVLISLPDCPV